MGLVYVGGRPGPRLFDFVGEGRIFGAGVMAMGEERTRIVESGVATEMSGEDDDGRGPCAGEGIVIVEGG